MPQAEKKAAKKTAKAKPPSQKSVREAYAQHAVLHRGNAFGYKHYVFIAKVKRGEIWALNTMKTASKAFVTPLFEMWPPKQIVKKGTVPKTLAAHTGDVLDIVQKEWTGLPCFLDTRYITSGKQQPASAAAVPVIFDAARQRNIDCVPVTSLGHIPAYQQAIAAVIAQDKRGVMVRLSTTNLNDEVLLQRLLDGLMSALNVKVGEVDILVDLAYRPNKMEVEQLGAAGLDNLPYIDHWRTVTLASGCFPASISTWPYSQWIAVDRSDWSGWNAIRLSRAAANKRLPSYGDYAVRCGGDPVEVPNAPDPNLRYSTQSQVLVRKEMNNPGAMKMMCSDLVARPDFAGGTFSQGDFELAAKAASQGSTANSNGSAEQWIQWCTNHHLELVVSETQSLP